MMRFISELKFDSMSLEQFLSNRVVIFYCIKYLKSRDLEKEDIMKYLA